MKYVKIFLIFSIAYLESVTLYAQTSLSSIDKRPPNIIIFLADDQGWGDLGINGNTNSRTPNIDALAKTGVRFERFYVSPVCSPTRAELLTGRYHPRGGVYGTSLGAERLDLDEHTIAEVFKRAGYQTGIFGKWHSGMQYPYHPNARGFTEFYGFCSGHWGDYFSPPLENNGEIVQGTGFITDDLTDKSLDFIQRNKDRPFFLYVPYNTPHSPMQVPDESWNQFRDQPLTMFADTALDEDINYTRASLAMSANIDWNVGRILKKINELNLEEETIIVYFSDNGPDRFRWNGGLKGKKGSTDEGGVRSPLFIRWTGVIDPNSAIDEIAGAIDLLPTLSELAGIDYSVPNPLDGISLKPLITGEAQRWDNRIIFSHWNGNISARTQQYVLDAAGKLYDIVRDPGQQVDVSLSKTDITNQLREAITHWKADVMQDYPNEGRLFPVGHPDFIYTQLPARDGIPFGQITRSNKSPNSTYFTNWTVKEDKILWPVEVLSTGDYEVELYYTCKKENTGCVVQLSFGPQTLAAKIVKEHDPPLRGMEHDRIVRTQSYVKDFRVFHMGTIYLEKGKGELSLEALDIPGEGVIELRTMMLTKR